MRVKAITIAGFGGVANEISIDLDADVVIVVGSNGYGKTTICNAISWVLSGKSSSVQGPRNLYSKSGTTVVELKAELHGEDFIITRSLDNPDETDPKKLRWPLHVKTAEGVLRGADAEQWLRRYLTGTDTNDDFDAIAESFVDSIYLKQESLREFLTVRQDTERFDAVASMVGAGRLREFADALQSHKRAWVRAINQSDAALEADRARLEDLTSSLSLLDGEIAKADAPEVEARWRAWVNDVSTLVLGELPNAGRGKITEQSLNEVRNMLMAARSSVEQNSSVLLAAQAELSVPLPEAPNERVIADLTTQIVQVGEAKAAAEDEMRRLRAELDEEESALRRSESLREDLANMASILLHHVSDSCAACGQSVNEQEYRVRLETLVADSEDSALRELVSLRREQFEDARTRARDKSSLLATLNDEKRVLLERRASALAMREHRENRLRDVMSGLDAPGVQSAGLAKGLEQIISELRRLSDQREVIIRALEEGRQFEAVASLGASRSRRERIAGEAVELRSGLADKEKDIAARRRTNDVATRLLEAVRSDAESFVAERLTQLRPLLTQFYAAIDPHPTFRTVEIATRQFGGRHRLTPILRDDDVRVDVTEPGETLSTSQANALAVSLFLSFNLGFAPTHAEALVLDDPLQNLDDVHLLGLVDLLRKILPYRQLIVTTHDHAFAALLARKLRPVSAAARTTYVRFTKWDRNGPGIEQWDVPVEAKPLKLVSA